ncbi:hypothetical protein Daura_15435 [Dactylosporangium aurantiacum]|uniref:Uncharacterized protein n=1 Tax=Dactylosporangium aurantiacum TaxID=35754 RepID=A0A9Q9IKU9_9ACTN|nr:DUF5995 family protein [Dactylosporangium aurantiacum]MDG6107801.1 DUF5995 family protein [Dactylosporangium aurantiacum]UWZ57421.1 hypothetical protein Daura_15435 [Dactylosporangium aurantiacum]
MDDAVAAVIARMEAGLTRLAPTDARRHFHGTYLRTTYAVAAEIDRGGFLDAAWLSRWDVAFAELYLDAFDADLAGDTAGGTVPRPWRIAFDTARDRPDLPPLRHVLLGMNAHINYDLPQSLIAVISPAEFDDPAVRAARERDHTHIDTVLLARVGAEEAEGRAAARPGLLDRILAPANRAATRRLLTEARAKVWRNTAVLDAARRQGVTAYTDGVRHLEDAAAAKLTTLTAPGQVLLRLARTGFGVLIPGA